MRAHQARPSTSERGWSSGQAVKLVRPVRGSSAWGVSLIESGEFRESATRLPGRDPHEPYRHETLYHQPDAVHGEWNYSLLPRQWLLLTEAVIS